MQTDRLGKYRIIAKLGQGGMATVYLSIVPGPVGFNKLLVVKELKEDLSHDNDFLSMFLNEARLAARLNHPNVVQTYEVGAEGARHYLAMDYLEGQPLHAVLRRISRQKMPLDLHVRILADALAGLHYAHTLKDFDGTPLHVVHRDVSPQNVFVTYDGQIKLVDFGIAKAAGASTTTQSGVFKGKLSYVAPEQAGGDPVDARADIFSVGVMLWEAIAGRRFAQGDGQTAILARRLAGTEPRIREVVPDCDAELAEICDRAMAHYPAHRFANGQEFRDALENFLDRFSRRVGSREVGALMVEAFAQERETIRAIIDDQMKQVMRETSTALPLPSLDVMQQSAFDPTPITTQHGIPRPIPIAPNSQPSYSQPNVPRMPGVFDPGPGSVSTTNNGTLVASHISQTPPAVKAGSRLLVGLAVAGVIAIGITGALVFFAKQPPSGEAAASAKPSAAAPASASQGDKVKLSITFGPSGVVAKLDGVPLDESPFVAQVPRDGSMHRLDVEGPGLKSETKMISYDKDIALSVTLVAGDASSAAPSAAPSDTVKRPTVPGPLDTSKTPKGGKQPLEIDENDPYKKK